MRPKCCARRARRKPCGSPSAHSCARIGEGSSPRKTLHAVKLREVQRDLTPMRRRAMLENIETLPPGGDGNLFLDLAHGETLTAVSALIVTVNEENGMARPRIKHKTWVVVADGGRALVMRNDGDATSPRLTVMPKYGE